MAPQKLSDADKRDVIELYKQPKETTSTIAERYGVSNSTISRILKQVLPPEDYSALIAQKRMASTAEKNGVELPTAPVEPPSSSKAKPILRSQKEAQPTAPEAEPEIGSATAAGDETLVSTAPRRRRRQSITDEHSTQLPLLAADLDADWSDAAYLDQAEPPITAADRVVATDDGAAADLLEDTDDDDFDDDDFEDDDFEDEDGEEFEDDDEAELTEFHVSNRSAALQIVPLQASMLPRTCYLVIDRLSELITRPLKDFADLGQIPAAAATAPTLPVFDNHRVARRFSRRNQRVIKVPDGQLLTKTSAYLQAKGITHLLVDGTVYSLIDNES
jgi:transposase-like protein